MAEGPSLSVTITLLKAFTAALIAISPVFYLAYTNRLPDRLPRPVIVVAVFPTTFLGVFYLDGYITIEAVGLLLAGIVLTVGLILGLKRAYHAFTVVVTQVWQLVRRTFA